MTHTLTVARHPRRGGRAPDRPRFFSQEHVGDKHAARRLMELPPVFDRGVWVWDEIRQDARPRLPFACMHARTCGAPRRSHTSRRFPRSMEHRSNGCPGRAGPARKRRRVNQRGRPVVVVHGEADTGGRNKQRPRHDPVGTWKADHCWCLCDCLAIRVSRMEISATGRDISAKWQLKFFLFFR